jgi:predicted Zn-dependent peptidase
MTGDWKALIEYQRALSEVSAEQVRDVAARTFVRSNRTVALLASPSEEAPHVVEESASTSGAR